MMDGPMVPWSELTDEQRAEHRKFCIEKARPDMDPAEVARMVDTLQLDEFDWEQRRIGAAIFGPREYGTGLLASVIRDRNQR